MKTDFSGLGKKDKVGVEQVLSVIFAIFQALLAIPGILIGVSSCSGFFHMFFLSSAKMPLSRILRAPEHVLQFFSACTDDCKTTEMIRTPQIMVKA